MNKQGEGGIEWCDYTWSPVTGCLHRCEYCYARRIAQRFGGASETVNSESGMECMWSSEETGKLHDLQNPVYDTDRSHNAPYPYYFDPTLHRYRLAEPARKIKPSNVFVCSMADLFGEWIPDSWIQKVFDACEAAPQHQYLFLTKNPGWYVRLAQQGLLPEVQDCDNMWFGTSMTIPDNDVFWSRNHFTFVSIEPIHGPFDLDAADLQQDWVIVGAETGNRKGKIVPERAWIESIVQACKDQEIPLFMKSSLAPIWGVPLIQQWPEGINPRL